MKIFNLLGKNVLTTPIYYRDIKRIADNNRRFTEDLYAREFYAFSKGARSMEGFRYIVPITVETIDVNDATVQEFLQVST